MSDVEEASYVELFVLRDGAGVVHLLGDRREAWHTLCGVPILGTWGIAYTGELDEAVTCPSCHAVAIAT